MKNSISNIIKKHPKKMISLTVFLIFIFLILFSIKYHLTSFVAVVTDIFVGPRIESTSIKFSDNKIEIENVKIKDYGMIIAESPKVEIIYSKDSLKRLRVENIIVYGGVANIERDKDEEINIVTTFAGKQGQKKYTEEDLKKYDPSTMIPIDNIDIRDVTLNYRDTFYREEIFKTIEHVSGFVSFDKKRGIDLEFTGVNNDEKYKFMMYDGYEPFFVRIKLENVKIDTNLMQYAYDGPELHYDGGIVNLDFGVSPLGMRGHGNFREVNLKYEDYDETIKNISGEVDFKDFNVYLKGSYDFFDETRLAELKYENNEFNLDLNFQDLDYAKLVKYKYVKEFNIPLQKFKLDNFFINLNVTEEKGFNLNLKFDSKESEFIGVEVKDLSGELVFDKTGLHIDKFDTKIKKFGIEKLLSLKLFYNEDKGNISISMADEKLKNDLLPNFEATVDFKKEKDKFNMDIKTDWVDLTASYDIAKSLLTVSDSKKFNVSYDVENNELKNDSGTLPIDVYGLGSILNYEIKDNVFKIQDYFIKNDENKKVFNAKGYIDLNKENFNIAYVSDNLSVRRNLNDSDFSFDFSSKGSINRQNNLIKIESKIENLEINSDFNFKISNGDFNFKSKEDTEFDFKGELSKIGYRGYYFEGFKADFKYKENKLEIIDLKNALINASGFIYTDDRDSEVIFDISDLHSSKFNLPDLNLEINSAQGKLVGNINNPTLSFELKDVDFELFGKKKINFKGKLEYCNNVFNFKNLMFDNNLLNGYYNLSDETYKFKLNIIEEEMSKYYGYRDIKYRLIAEAILKGKAGDLEVNLEGNLDKVYYMEHQLPKIYINGNYKAKNYIDGILWFKEIRFKNEKDKILANATASINLATQYMDFVFNNQKIKLQDLKDYSKIDFIAGDLNFHGNLFGNLEGLNYQLNSSSNNISIQGNKLDSLNLNIKGDLNILEIEKFNFAYQGNRVDSLAVLDLKTNYYNAMLISENINLKIIEPFLKEYGINNVNGTANFDMALSNDKNTGQLNIKNLNLDSEEYYLYFRNVNSNINLHDDRLNIGHFNSELNKGKLSIKGDMEIPDLRERKDLLKILETLNYNLKIKLENMEYNYPEIFKAKISSRMDIGANNILGSIDIKDSVLSDIPSNSKSIWQVIINFLKRSSYETLGKSEDNPEELTIVSSLSKLFNVNVSLDLNEGMKLDVDRVNLAVEDLKGNLEGYLMLIGKEGKYYLLGEGEVFDGSLLVNDNLFYLDRATIKFNDNKVYLPDFNPNVFIESSANIDGDDLQFFINGELNSLRFVVNSKDGTSSGFLNSLINEDSESSLENEKSMSIIRNMFTGQVTKTVLGPISRFIRKNLYLSKFKISSDILNNTLKKDGEINKDIFTVGTKIEVENKLFYDNLFWQYDFKIKNDNKGQPLYDYDFNIEYRDKKGYRLGIGAGSTSDDTGKIEAKENKKINYHIDLKFKKRYENFSDIFLEPFF